MKKLIYAAVGLALIANTLAFAPVSAATALEPDTVIKGLSHSTLYYYATDGKRYAFPNDKVYFSWFTNFNDVVTISDEELAQIPLGGVVHYRPGILLVKIQTDPKVYAVGEKGILRWIKSEILARALYGNDWNILVDDLPASFFAQYLLGSPIISPSDYDADEEANDAPSISHSKGLRLGRLKHGSDTEKCRAIPAVPAHKIGQKGRATPAVPARDCARQKHEDGDELNISSINSAVSTSTASITWFSDERATGKVTYNTQYLDTATTTNQTMSSDSLVKFHNFLLTGLTPQTTYYYKVESTDEDNNTATSSEKTFTTLAETTTDTTVPVLNNITATTTVSTATISWTTNEPATSITVYADEILTTATSSQTVSNSNLVSSHSLTITGLNASTTYYYIVKSADGSGNLATSTEKTFTTLSPADVNPPIISNILAQTTTTTATITWTTNEPADSLVKYSLQDLDTATTTSSLNSSLLVTSHSLLISGLTASTTYHYLVRSADASANVTTSIQQIFSTTP